jgi:hypothetical protein
VCGCPHLSLGGDGKLRLSSTGGAERAESRCAVARDSGAGGGIGFIGGVLGAAVAQNRYLLAAVLAAMNPE